MKILKKLIASLGYSVDGIKAVWKKELSFRLEVYVCIIAMPIIILITVSKVEKLILILLLLLLLTLELVNSSIEVLVDRISTEINPLSKIAKDACSAAVGMVILMNMLAWLFVLL